jgi:hypothetical protein
MLIDRSSALSSLSSHCSQIPFGLTFQITVFLSQAITARSMSATSSMAFSMSATSSMRFYPSIKRSIRTTIYTKTSCLFNLKTLYSECHYDNMNAMIVFLFSSLFHMCSRSSSCSFVAILLVKKDLGLFCMYLFNQCL